MLRPRADQTRGLTSQCSFSATISNKTLAPAMLRIRIRINKGLPDPDPHGQMRNRIQEVKKPRKYTGLLGEYRTGI